MTTQAIRFVAWGELLWDLFPDAARLGGAAANAAYHAACLGAHSLLVSRVGNDELGTRALKLLGERGVETHAIQIDDGAPTGTVSVTIENGEPRYRIASGVAWDRIGWRDELAAEFAQASVVCFGTLAQRSPLGFDAVEQALAHCPASTLRICDLNVREPFATPQVIDRALSLSRVVKLNESELSTLARLFGQRDALRWLLEERGIELVAVTRGARGASLSSRQAHFEHAGFPLSSTSGDAVGAGDAFSACLSLELARGSSPELALQNANRYAAHVASEPGAMPPAPSWLDRRPLD